MAGTTCGYGSWLTSHSELSAGTAIAAGAFCRAHDADRRCHLFARSPVRSQPLATTRAVPGTLEKFSTRGRNGGANHDRGCQPAPATGAAAAVAGAKLSRL